MRDDGPGTEVLRRCACLKVRRASRSVAQMWDAHLAGAGITNGQLSLLAQVELRREAAMSSLARGLHLERTSLTRNLARLQAMGAVAVDAPADDMRRRIVRVTAEGEALLAEAFPRWVEAQTRLRVAAGGEAWDRSIDVAGHLTALVSPKADAARRPRSAGRDSAPPLRPSGPLTADMVEVLRQQMCLCTTLRRCARAVSGRYDTSLRSVHLKVSRLHVLAAVEAHPRASPGRLIETLTLDQSTLSRTMKRLEDLGLVQGDAGGGARGPRLTDPGKSLLNEAVSRWRDAQSLFDDVSLPPSEDRSGAEGGNTVATASRLVREFARSFAPSTTGRRPH